MLEVNSQLRVVWIDSQVNFFTGKKVGIRENILRYILLFQPYKHILREKVTSWYAESLACYNVFAVQMSILNRELKKNNLIIQGFKTKHDKYSFRTSKLNVITLREYYENILQ